MEKQHKKEKSLKEQIKTVRLEIKNIKKLLKDNTIEELNQKSAKERGCAHSLYSSSKCSENNKKKICNGLPVCLFHYEDYDCKTLGQKNTKV